MSAITYVGMAYGAIFLLFFVYTWRLTATTRRLDEKIEELEREAERRDRS